MLTDVSVTSELIRELPTSLVADGPEIPPHHPKMDDIYNVGPDKPLGYRSLESIRMCGEYPDDVANLSQQRGLSVVLAAKETSMVVEDALYVYDEKALDHLLKTHQTLLDRLGWPSEPADFVERIIGEIVDKRNSELFTLIAWAFKDPRPEYQRPNPEATVTRRSFMSRTLGRLGIGGH